VDTGVCRWAPSVKVGADYRRLRRLPEPESPNVLHISYLSGRTSELWNLGVSRTMRLPTLSTPFLRLGQDEWRITPRLNLSMGLRWEVNPAPGAPSGNLPYTVQGSSRLRLRSHRKERRCGRRLVQLAPRLGVAFVLRNKLIRDRTAGGEGISDTGQQSVR